MHQRFVWWPVHSNMEVVHNGGVDEVGCLRKVDGRLRRVDSSTSTCAMSGLWHEEARCGAQGVVFWLKFLPHLNRVCMHQNKRPNGGKSLSINYSLWTCWHKINWTCFTGIVYLVICICGSWMTEYILWGFLWTPNEVFPFYVISDLCTLNVVTCLHFEFEIVHWTDR